MFGPYPRASLKPKKQDEADEKEAQKLDLSLDEYRRYKLKEKLPPFLGAFTRASEAVPGVLFDTVALPYNLPKLITGKPITSFTSYIEDKYDKATNKKHEPTSNIGKVGYAALQSVAGIPGLKMPRLKVPAKSIKFGAPRAVKLGAEKLGQFGLNMFTPGTVPGTLSAMAGQAAANSTNNPLAIFSAGLATPYAAKKITNIPRGISNIKNRYDLNALKKDPFLQEAIENKIADIGGSNDLLKMTDHKTGEYIRDAAHVQKKRYGDHFKSEYGRVNEAAEALNPPIYIGHAVDDWIKDYLDLETAGARQLALNTPAGKKVTQLLSIRSPNEKFIDNKKNKKKRILNSENYHETTSGKSDVDEEKAKDFVNRFDGYLKNHYKGASSFEPVSYKVANLFTKDINNSLSRAQEIGNIYQGQLKYLNAKLNNQIYQALPLDLAQQRRKVEDAYSVWAQTGKQRVNKVLHNEYSPTEITRNFDYTIPENISFIQEGMHAPQKNKLSQGILGQLGFENNKKINPLKLHNNLGKTQSTVEELIINGLDPDQLSKLNKQHDYVKQYKRVVDAPASLTIEKTAPTKVSYWAKKLGPLFKDPYKPLEQKKIDKTFNALEKRMQPPKKPLLNPTLGRSIGATSHLYESEQDVDNKEIYKLEAELAQNEINKLEAELAQNEIAKQALNGNK